MAEKISVYVDKELHRALKAEASLRGKSLSEFMVEAALRILHAPDRRISSAKMDDIRNSVKGTFSGEELRIMRNEGRL
ncbi:MAG: type II toxin-antitoxin system HicB family antitoxin [Firmicutes bacterium]|nr:type II toxin-antitoxin system HicB family antitoxin [Bacillota bacterium]